MQQESCVRSASHRRTSRASRAEASFPRSLRSATPIWSAASCFRARGPCPIRIYARGASSFAHSSRLRPANALSSKGFSCASTRREHTMTVWLTKSSTRPRVPAQAVDAGPAAFPRRVSQSRHQRPPATDCRPDTRARGWHDESAGAMPNGRRADPRRQIRGDGGGGSPALPGSSGRVEQARRRLLAGSGSFPPGLITRSTRSAKRPDPPLARRRPALPCRWRGCWGWRGVAVGLAAA